MNISTSAELGLRLTNFRESLEKAKVSRCVRVFRFEAHARRKILLVLGEVTVTVVVSLLGKVERQFTDDFKKTIRLIGLTRSCSSEKVAKDIMQSCPFIDGSMLINLIEVIEELKSKEYDQDGVAVQRHTAADGSFLPRFPEFFDEFDLAEATGFEVVDDEPDFGNLNQYVENLYEDIPHKVEASLCLAKLAKCNAYLKDIAEHDSAVNALFRTLREDSKKSSVLNKNILSICLEFARFKDFHEILTNHRIHLLTLDIIDFELGRYEKWKTQLVEMEATAGSCTRSVNECHEMWIRLDELTSSQNAFLKIAFDVLHYMSEDARTRKVLVQRKVIASLCDTIERRDNELLEVVTAFLKSLSCFRPCIEDMIAVGLVEKLASVLKEGTLLPKKVVTHSLHLLYNLAFHSTLKERIVEQGLVRSISNCFENTQFREISAKLLYLLSMDAPCRGKMAKLSLVNSIMECLVSENEIGPTTMTIVCGLALNISRTRKGAKLIWESGNLGAVIRKALASQDILRMKIIRNLAEQDVAFVIYENVGEISGRIVTSTRPDFVTECLGTLASLDMTQVDVESVIQSGKIFPWLKQTLAYYLDKLNKRAADVNFDLPRTTAVMVLFLANVCSVEEGARFVVGEGLLDLLLKIVHAECQSESFALEHILFLFKTCTIHRSISLYLAAKTLLPSGLLELAESSSGHLRQECIFILEQIGKFDDTWKENVQQFQFLMWNKSWLDAVHFQDMANGESDTEEQPFRFPTSRFMRYCEGRGASQSESSDDDYWSSENSSSDCRDADVFGMFRQQFEEEMGYDQNHSGDEQRNFNPNCEGWNYF